MGFQCCSRVNPVHLISSLGETSFFRPAVAARETSLPPLGRVMVDELPSRGFHPNIFPREQGVVAMGPTTFTRRVKHSREGLADFLVSQPNDRPTRSRWLGLEAG